MPVALLDIHWYTCGWVGSHLGECELVAAVEEGRSVGEERLNLLDDAGGSVFDHLLAHRRRVGELEDMRLNLGRPRIREEVDPCPGESTLGVRRRRQEVGRVGVGQELGDDGGLGDDLSVVGDGGHQAAGVDLEVLGGPRGV